MNVLEQLDQVLSERKQASADTSYVASLYADGLNKILQKVGEESVEVILAAKNVELDPNAKASVINEVADLWFHSLVMLHQLELDSEAVTAELGRRFGISGHDEKRARDGN